MECNIDYRVIHQDTLCCEPIIRRMPWGFLLLCECGGPMEPHPDNKMLSFTSLDGENWEGPFVVWPDQEGAQCMCEMLCSADGYAYGFFLHHNGTNVDLETVVMRSKDGRSWEKVNLPAEYADMTIFRSAAELPDKSGMLLPYSHYIKAGGDVAPDKKIWSPGVIHHVENHVLHYDRSGKITNSSGPAITTFPTAWGRNFIWTESALTFIDDHTAAMLIRMDGTGVLYISYSDDNGDTWSQPVPTTIPNPGSKVRLFKLPDGRIVLLHTPNPKERRPFEMWISSDGLKTFSEKRTLLAEDGRLYHYADCIWHDGQLWITIERDRRDILVMHCNV